MLGAGYPVFLLAFTVRISILYMLILPSYGYGVAASIVLPLAIGAILGYGCRTHKAIIAILWLMLIISVTVGLFTMGFTGIFCSVIIGSLALAPAFVGILMGSPPCVSGSKKSKFSQWEHLPVLLFSFSP